MALIKCPECKSTVSDKADKCPNCAFPLRKKTEEKSEGCFLQTLNAGCLIIVIGILFILFVILALGFLG